MTGTGKLPFGIGIPPSSSVGSTTKAPSRKPSLSTIDGEKAPFANTEVSGIAPVRNRFFRNPCLFSASFSGAPTHLYNWLCPLIGWSVGNANV